MLRFCVPPPLHYPGVRERSSLLSKHEINVSPGPFPPASPSALPFSPPGCSCSSKNANIPTRTAIFPWCSPKHFLRNPRPRPLSPPKPKQGQGVDRLIYALRAAAQASAEGSSDKWGMLGAAFFEDPLLAESSHWKLSTSNLSVPHLTLFG